MEADFSGWATKAGLKCSDGRTIMPNAFQHQDETQVPLVWQHGHKDPQNVLGHVLLENRDEGVYAYGFFNKSAAAEAAREALEHGDINSMSIWANDLVERAKQVLHGAIREVSLVLSGANPGAVIEHVTLRHSDDTETELEDEVIIYTGLELEHAAGDDDEEETVEEVYESMTPKQKEVLHYMIGVALEEGGGGTVEQSALTHADSTVKEVYDSMTDDQKKVLHFLVGQAVEEASLEQSNLNNNDGSGTEMRHNVFEDDKKGGSPQVVISHSDMESIVADATSGGSLKEAVKAYALSHGIQDIDTLFPEARSITNTPELFARRTEWVNNLMNAVRKSPFSRIRTMSADITVQEARAKGYITGTLKKEEFFRVSKRVTTPQTVYKKQKLDRDDILDITDFDVVVWLKGEMRVMLDEEIARAVLVGDGRAADDEDKISEDHIRPIARDHELYTTKINVEIDDTPGTITTLIDRLVLNRHHLRGTGLPTLYTSETYIARFMLLRDGVGRRIYKNLDELAAELRVKEIVSVEILEEYEDIIGILVNPVDYVVGADRGGDVSMFDDFDIDYNQYKYLIETRLSGALVKLKSAMVLMKVNPASNEIVPAEPDFDGDSVTITDQAGVVYRNADTDVVLNAAGSPYAVAEGTTLNVRAEAANGYHFPSSEVDDWSFTNEG